MLNNSIHCGVDILVHSNFILLQLFLLKHDFHLEKAIMKEN
jgi:hypothetical protein